MLILGELATWLTVVLGVWCIVAVRSAPASDSRLLASGARGLHAAAVLMVVAALAAVWTVRGEAIAATGQAPASIIARAMLGGWPTYVIVVAMVVAVFAALVPWMARAGGERDRTRPGVVAGACVAVAAAAALAIRAATSPAPEDAAVAAELHHWGGIAFLLLYPVGVAASLIPVAIGRVRELTTRRLRWTLHGLAAMLAALAAGAWARYAGAAPAPELDVAGALADRPWTTAHLLLLVPPLLLTAGAHALHARRRAAAADAAPARVATALLLLVAAMVVAVVGPAVVDWVAGREIEFGAPVAPLRGAIAIAVAVVLGAAAAWCAARVRHSGASDSRLLSAVHASAFAALALAVVAMSSPVQSIEIGPGSSVPIHAGGRIWKATSQGTSQVDGGTYDGAVVALLLERDGVQRFVTAGERLYRDPQGHNAARVAVPGILRRPSGDLRVTVRGLRGDEALVRAQFHPLATPAWLLAAATIVLLLAGAVALRADATGMGSR